MSRGWGLAVSWSHLISGSSRHISSVEAKGRKTARNHFEDKLQQIVSSSPFSLVFPTSILVFNLGPLFQRRPASDVYSSGDLAVMSLPF